MNLQLPPLTTLAAQVTAIRNAAESIELPDRVLDNADKALEELTELASQAEQALYAGQIDGWGDRAAQDLIAGKLDWNGLIGLCAGSEGIGIRRAEQIVERAAQIIAARANPRTAADWPTLFKTAADELAAQAENKAPRLTTPGRSLGPHGNTPHAVANYHTMRQWLFKWDALHDHAEKFRTLRLMSPSTFPRHEHEWERPDLVPVVTHPDDLVNSYVIGITQGAGLTFATAEQVRARHRHAT